jgi:hypothetical protein
MAPENIQGGSIGGQKFSNSGLLSTVLTKNLNQGTDASFLQKSKVFENFEKLTKLKSK